VEITVKNLFDWVVKGIVFILVITLVFGVSVFAYTKYFVQPTYTAQVKFFAGGDNRGNSGQSLAPQCVEVLNVNEFYDLVAKELLADTGVTVTPSGIASTIRFSSIIEDTSFFRVTVTANDPTLAYNIALAVAEQAPERVGQFEELGSLGISSHPVLPTSPSGPNVARNTLLGILVGLVLSVGIVVAREALDNRIKSPDEITELFGLPVFGVVPDFSGGERKGAKK